jgi:hypothetical protein
VRRQGLACTSPTSGFEIDPTEATSKVEARRRMLADGTITARIDCYPGNGITVWRCVDRQWTPDCDASLSVAVREGQIELVYAMPGVLIWTPCVSPATADAGR